MSHKYFALLSLPECVILQKRGLKQNLCTLYCTFPLWSSPSVTHTHNGWLVNPPRRRLPAGPSAAGSGLSFAEVKSPSPGVSEGIQTSEVRYPQVNTVCILSTSVFLLCWFKSKLFFTFDVQILIFKWFPYWVPKSHARSDRVQGRSQSRAHLPPSPSAPCPWHRTWRR